MVILVSVPDCLFIFGVKIYFGLRHLLSIAYFYLNTSLTIHIVLQLDLIILEMQKNSRRIISTRSYELICKMGNNDKIKLNLLRSYIYDLCVVKRVVSVAIR